MPQQRRVMERESTNEYDQSFLKFSLKWLLWGTKTFLILGAIIILTFLFSGIVQASTLQYTGTNTTISLSNPKSLYWDGTNWWINNDEAEPGTSKIYKYNSTFSYTGINKNISDSSTDIWYGTSGWTILIDSGTKAARYNTTWTNTLNYTIPTPAYFNGLFFDGTNWWLSDTASDRVYKYNSTFGNATLSNTSYSVLIAPIDIFWDGNNWWVLNFYGTIYRYNSSWDYLGINYSVATQTNSPQHFYLNSTVLTLLDTNKVYKYNILFSNPSAPTISKPKSTTVTVNNEKLEINYSASVPDYGLSITGYNITLVDTLGNYVTTINDSLTTTNFNWTVNVSDGGSYKIKVTANDNASQTNYSLSDTFVIYATTLNITAKDNYTNTNIQNFVITPGGTNWYNATSLTTTTGNVSLYTFYNYPLLINITSTNYAPTSTIYSTNTSYFNYTFMLNPAGALFVTITNQLNGSVITPSLSNLTLRSGTYLNQTSTTNGYFNFTNLGSGDYVLTVRNANYSTADFYVTMQSNSYQTINARLLPNTTNSTIGFNIKSTTYQELPNTSITIQRQYLGGSWATTNMLTTDENGFVSAQLQEGETYRFIISSPGYGIKQFDQAVYAALSPYTFLLTPSSSGLYTNYWDGVNYYYYPTGTQLSRGIYNFTITVYNSTKDISWVSVNANGNIVNVTSSPSGGTASYTADLNAFTGVYPVTYTFFFFDNRAQDYTYKSIFVNYYVNTYNLTQTTLNTTLSNIKDDMTNGNPGMGEAWAVIIATFIILAIMITLIQISGQPILGVLGGVLGTGFFAYVGWISPVYAGISCVLILLILVFNR